MCVCGGGHLYQRQVSVCLSNDLVYLSDHERAHAPWRASEAEMGGLALPPRVAPLVSSPVSMCGRTRGGAGGPRPEGPHVPRVMTNVSEVSSQIYSPTPHLLISSSSPASVYPLLSNSMGYQAPPPSPWFPCLAPHRLVTGAWEPGAVPASRLVLGAGEILPRPLGLAGWWAPQAPSRVLGLLLGAGKPDTAPSGAPFFLSPSPGSPNTSLAGAPEQDSGQRSAWI